MALYSPNWGRYIRRAQRRVMLGCHMYRLKWVDMSQIKKSLLARLPGRIDRRQTLFHKKLEAAMWDMVRRGITPS